jgi:hypothetical protein
MIAQCLYKLGDFNIHTSNDIAFRWACRDDHLTIAQ